MLVKGQEFFEKFLWKNPLFRTRNLLNFYTGTTGRMMIFGKNETTYFRKCEIMKRSHQSLHFSVIAIPSLPREKQSLRFFIREIATLPRQNVGIARNNKVGMREIASSLRSSQ